MAIRPAARDLTTDSGDSEIERSGVRTSVPARPRHLPQEPTVVIAWDVAAHDEPSRSVALARGGVAAEPRKQADTIPPEREISRLGRQARVQSQLLVVAAVLLLASAGILVKGAVDQPEGLAAIKRHVRMVKAPDVSSGSKAPSRSVDLHGAAGKPEPPPAPPAWLVAPVGPVEAPSAEEVTFTPTRAPRAMPSVSPSSDSPRATRRPRAPRKSRPEIVRDNPF